LQGYRPYAAQAKDVFNGMLSMLSSERSELVVLPLLHGAPSLALTAIGKTAADLQSTGEEHLAAARRARNIGEYYGSLFMSIPWLLAATKGFNIVAEFFPDQRQRATINKNFCDELATLAMAAMRVQFFDSLDRRDVLSCREHIRVTRGTKGKSEAEALADQYIETDLFYPDYFRPFLLGDTDALPTRR
jgi:hypothetical protein